MDMPSTLLHWTLSAPLRFSISVFPSRKMEYFCRNNCDCIFLLFRDCCMLYKLTFVYAMHLKALVNHTKL